MTTSDIIKKVRRLEIRTRQLVTDSVTGAYHSSFKGRGMDFEEVREYAIGDDVRTIDWNVSAKMDKPFVKIFREERELTLMLLVDLSASGIFGSVEQSKRERAAEIAAVLAFSATLNNDKVGLLLYTDEVEHYIPPKKGRRHVLRLIRDILAFEPRGRRTRHQAALDYLNRVQRRKAVVFLISDFLENEPPSGLSPQPSSLPHPSGLRSHPSSLPHPSGLRSQPSGLSPHPSSLRSQVSGLSPHPSIILTHQRHDLVCIALSDPREECLPNVGIIAVEDAETGEVVEIDTGSAAVRQRYAEAARQRRESFESEMRKNGLDWIQARTDEPYLPALRRLFARRASRH